MGIIVNDSQQHKEAMERKARLNTMLCSAVALGGSSLGMFRREPKPTDPVSFSELCERLRGQKQDGA